MCGCERRRRHTRCALVTGVQTCAHPIYDWGFVPITDAEVAHTGKKLKPIVFEDLIRIAELDGEPVAFVMTMPDFNEAIKPLNGSLFPFGWIKLLRWLHKPKCRTMREIGRAHV